ncbi:HNH endonuclease signature motif containing protein [Brevundimonas sp.]|uniref:HNH endonuclease signature motif containing protein n=1 Tax=Brevundimonas sp. TaxID=1871086 RepID=UPI0028A12D8F|nr:HNH endonuclease signature motif containing protein [Brevundimonas sp.]
MGKVIRTAPVSCAFCGKVVEKRADRVIAAAAAEKPLYCDRICMGAGKAQANAARRASERLSDCFTYDPETGAVSRPLKRGRGQTGPVGVVGLNGYVVVRFNGRAITVHRLAWELHYGSAPDGMIDHINGDRTDNRIVNLRLATAGQNQANRHRSIGKSGLKGVSLHRSTGRWRATIQDRHLGLFDTPEEAAKAYDAAAVATWGAFAAPNFGGASNG